MRAGDVLCDDSLHISLFRFRPGSDSSACMSGKRTTCHASARRKRMVLWRLRGVARSRKRFRSIIRQPVSQVLEGCEYPGRRGALRAVTLDLATRNSPSGPQDRCAVNRVGHDEFSSWHFSETPAEGRACKRYQGEPSETRHVYHTGRSTRHSCCVT